MQNGSVPGGGGPNGQTTQPDPQIVRALELIYDPRSSNESRREASQYLDQLTSQD